MKFSVLNCWKSEFAVIRIFAVYVTWWFWALHAACWSDITLVKSCKCFWHSFDWFKRVSRRNLVLNFLFELLWVLARNLSWHIKSCLLFINLNRIAHFLFLLNWFWFPAIYFRLYMSVGRSLSCIFCLLT